MIMLPSKNINVSCFMWYVNFLIFECPQYIFVYTKEEEKIQIADPLFVAFYKFCNKTDKTVDAFELKYVIEDTWRAGVYNAFFYIICKLFYLLYSNTRSPRHRRTQMHSYAFINSESFTETIWTHICGYRCNTLIHNRKIYKKKYVKPCQWG